LYNNTQNIKYKSKQDIRWQSCEGGIDLKNKSQVTKTVNSYADYND